ncbi:MAG: hypothetical protein WBV68_09735 [Exiguobacterium oxidotolerans]|uniref:Uncharacterized protein n=1 Tax=Exiguobacterium oxidotolerans TaxID=223958 RepID=A0A653IGB8_9BACL|nr:hypothetical protein [Exiguobacterium oxidotolerans]VWX38178.1 conserved hypothetical protein [Exiguobacterium oxidotolerans]
MAHETDRSRELLENEQKRLTEQERELSPEQQEEILKGKEQMPDDPAIAREQDN